MTKAERELTSAERARHNLVEMSVSEGLRRQKQGDQELQEGLGTPYETQTQTQTQTHLDARATASHTPGQSSKSAQQGAADDTAAGGGVGGGGVGGGGTKIAVFTPRTGQGGLDGGGAGRTQGTMAPAAAAAAGVCIANGDEMWGVMHAKGTRENTFSKGLSTASVCSKCSRALTCQNSGSVANVANGALPLGPTHVRRPASAPAAVVPKVCLFVRERVSE